MSDISGVNEAAEALVQGILNAFAGEDDDYSVPFRRLLEGIGRECGVQMEAGDLLRLDEEMPLGEVRRRARLARAGLARGVGP